MKLQYVLLLAILVGACASGTDDNQSNWDLCAMARAAAMLRTTPGESSNFGSELARANAVKC